MDTGVTKLVFISVTFYCLTEKIISAPTTDNQKSGQLTGQALIDIGRKLNTPLLRLIGKTFSNFDIEIQKKMESDKKEIVKEMCRLHPCSNWSAWSGCDATTLGEFGGQTRNKNCGYNTTLCEQYAETSVEYDYRVCEYTCPDDYNVTKHGFCLKLYATDKIPRDDAEVKCQSDGGHLVNVDSSEKVLDVNATLSKWSFSDKLWIDGRRTVQAGPWKYGYESVDPSFTFWGGNDPDNGVNDLCMIYYLVGSWRKYDYACSQKLGFMCQITV